MTGPAASFLFPAIVNIEIPYRKNVVEYDGFPEGLREASPEYKTMQNKTIPLLYCVAMYPDTDTVRESIRLDADNPDKANTWGTHIEAPVIKFELIVDGQKLHRVWYFKDERERDVYWKDHLASSLDEICRWRQDKWGTFAVSQ